MDNPEKLTTRRRQTKHNHNKMKINVREYRRGNKKWTIQRNWQHSVCKKETKPTHNTMRIGQNYAQTNTNNVIKTWDNTN